MEFAVTDEEQMLRDSVRSFLEARAPLSRVRTIMETETGHDAELWAEIAGLGWPGLAIAEEHGGAGYTMRELGIVMEELGRSLLPAPFLSSVVLGAGAVGIAGSEEQRAQLLPGVASGERIVAVATVEQGRGWGVSDIATTVREEDGSLVIDGVKSYVVDGHIADTLLVSARTESGDVDLLIVDAGGEGVTVRRLETMDMTRKQAEVSLDSVQVPESARLGEPGSAVATLEALYDLAAVALAYEQVGGAQRCLEMSVGYAKDREQFGRAIGSFQAVKHKCADMLIRVESARSAAYFAGWAAASGNAAELAIAAPLAKSYCSQAFFENAGDTIQVHGGIGFTWEHDAHLFFKRAKADELLLGEPSRWRAKLADRLGL
jgi:alkylation response protein AidB-like acyl-CoA dehydrogenase